MIEQDREELIFDFERTIDRFLCDPEQLAANYNSYAFPERNLFTKCLVEKCGKLLFHPTADDLKNRYYYAEFLKSPYVWFNLYFVFEKEEKQLLDFVDMSHEEDSGQRFFCDIIYCLFKMGYRMSKDEQSSILDKLAELNTIAKSEHSVVIPIQLRHELLKYSLLQCYKNIQNAGLGSRQEMEYYLLLHENWRFISKLLSVLLNVIIGCDLSNMAGIANNIKDRHLHFAHLFILAAESERGRKNIYKGNKKVDRLFTLKKEMETNPQYLADQRLDMLIPILFPKVENFKSLK